MNQPVLRERVAKGGSELMLGSPERFAKDMEEESQTWSRVIREKGIKAE